MEKKNINNEIDRLRSELASVKSARQDERLNHHVSMEQLRTKLNDTERTLKHSIKNNMRNKSPLYQYMEASRRARGAEDAVPTYVLTWEGQLCRSMHHMLTLESDLHSNEEKSAALVDWLKSRGACLAEEKAAVELMVMNSIMMLEQEISSMQEDHDAKLEQQETVICMLGGRKQHQKQQRISETLDNIKKKMEQSPIFAASRKRMEQSPLFAASSRKGASPLPCKTRKPANKLFGRRLLWASPVA